MTKRTLAALFSAALAFTAFAAPVAAMDFLKPVDVSFTTGTVQQDSGHEDLYLLGIEPKFEAGNFYFTLGLNMYVENDFSLRDGGNDWLVLDSAGYKNNNLDLYYGDLKNITYGSGFVVSNYRSDIRGNVPLNRQKGGTVALTGGRSEFRAFGTRTGLNGLRAVRNMGRVSAGMTAVSDSEPDFEEIGVDISLAQLPLGTTAYVESAKINGYGDGWLIGLGAAPLEFLSTRVEYRDYDSDFIPGIVDEHYEAVNSVDRIKTNPAGRRSGYYTRIGLFENHKTSLAAVYEDYEEMQPRAALTARINPSRNISADFFYADESFVPNTASGDKTIIRSSLTYRTRRHADIILEYYDAYDDDKTPLESFAVKFKFRMK